MSVGANKEDSIAPGGGFRFAVGSASGPHSTVHRVWTGKNSANVYMTSIPVAGIQKVSLHESGEWQQSFNSEIAMKYVERNADRHIDKWRRPNSLAPGWTRGYLIRIPRTELRSTNQDLSDVRWADDPGAGYWVNIDLVLMDGRGAGSTMEWDNAMVLGNLAVSDGSAVTVVAQRYRPDVSMTQELERYRDVFLREIPDPEHQIGKFPVVALYGYLDDGTRFMTELAMSIVPAEVRTFCASKHQDAPARMSARWRDRRTLG